MKRIQQHNRPLPAHYHSKEYPSRSSCSNNAVLFDVLAVSSCRPTMFSLISFSSFFALWRQWIGCTIGLQEGMQTWLALFLIASKPPTLSTLLLHQNVCRDLLGVISVGSIPSKYLYRLRFIWLIRHHVQIVLDWLPTEHCCCCCCCCLIEECIRVPL